MGIIYDVGGEKQPPAPVVKPKPVVKVTQRTLGGHPVQLEEPTPAPQSTPAPTPSQIIYGGHPVELEEPAPVPYSPPPSPIGYPQPIGPQPYVPTPIAPEITPETYGPQPVPVVMPPEGSIEWYQQQGYAPIMGGEPPQLAQVQTQFNLALASGDQQKIEQARINLNTVVKQQVNLSPEYKEYYQYISDMAVLKPYQTTEGWKLADIYAKEDKDAIEVAERLFKEEDINEAKEAAVWQRAWANVQKDYGEFIDPANNNLLIGALAENLVKSGQSIRRAGDALSPVYGEEIKEELKKEYDRQSLLTLYVSRTEPDKYDVDRIIDDAIKKKQDIKAYLVYLGFDADKVLGSLDLKDLEAGFLKDSSSIQNAALKRAGIKVAVDITYEDRARLNELERMKAGGWLDTDALKTEYANLKGKISGAGVSQEAWDKLPQSEKATILIQYSKVQEGLGTVTAVPLVEPIGLAIGEGVITAKAWIEKTPSIPVLKPAVKVAGGLLTSVGAAFWSIPVIVGQVGEYPQTAPSVVKGMVEFGVEAGKGTLKGDPWAAGELAFFAIPAVKGGYGATKYVYQNKAKIGFALDSLMTKAMHTASVDSLIGKSSISREIGAQNASYAFMEAKHMKAAGATLAQIDSMLSKKFGIDNPKQVMKEWDAMVDSYLPHDYKLTIDVKNNTAKVVDFAAQGEKALLDTFGVKGLQTLSKEFRAIEDAYLAKDVPMMMQAGGRLQAIGNAMRDAGVTGWQTVYEYGRLVKTQASGLIKDGAKRFEPAVNSLSKRMEWFDPTKEMPLPPETGRVLLDTIRDFIDKRNKAKLAKEKELRRLEQQKEQARLYSESVEKWDAQIREASAKYAEIKAELEKLQEQLDRAQGKEPTEAWMKGRGWDVPEGYKINIFGQNKDGTWIVRVERPNKRAVNIQDLKEGESFLEALKRAEEAELAAEAKAIEAAKEGLKVESPEEYAARRRAEAMEELNKIVKELPESAAEKAAIAKVEAKAKSDAAWKKIEAQLKKHGGYGEMPPGWEPRLGAKPKAPELPKTVTEEGTVKMFGKEIKYKKTRPKTDVEKLLDEAQAEIRDNVWERELTARERTRLDQAFRAIEEQARERAWEKTQKRLEDAEKQEFLREKEINETARLSDLLINDKIKEWLTEQAKAEKGKKVADQWKDVDVDKAVKDIAEKVDKEFADLIEKQKRGLPDEQLADLRQRAARQRAEATKKTVGEKWSDEQAKKRAEHQKLIKEAQQREIEKLRAAGEELRRAREEARTVPEAPGELESFVKGLAPEEPPKPKMFPSAEEMRGIKRREGVQEAGKREVKKLREQAEQERQRAKEARQKVKTALEEKVKTEDVQYQDLIKKAKELEEFREAFKKATKKEVDAIDAELSLAEQEALLRRAKESKKMEEARREMEKQKAEEAGEPATEKPLTKQEKQDKIKVRYEEEMDWWTKKGASPTEAATYALIGTALLEALEEGITTVPDQVTAPIIVTTPSTIIPMPKRTIFDQTVPQKGISFAPILQPEEAEKEKEQEYPWGQPMPEKYPWEQPMPTPVGLVLPVPEPEPEPRPEPEPAPEPEPTKPKPRTPIAGALPHGKEPKEKRTGKVAYGTWVWRHGAYWEVLEPPYDKVRHIKNPPEGAYLFATGKGSAAKTLQIIPKGARPPRGEVRVDVGWAEAVIVPDSASPGGGKVEFIGHSKGRPKKGQTKAEKAARGEMVEEPRRSRLPKEAEPEQQESVLPQENIIRPQARTVEMPDVAAKTHPMSWAAQADVLPTRAGTPVMRTASLTDIEESMPVVRHVAMRGRRRAVSEGEPSYGRYYFGRRVLDSDMAGVL